MNLIALMAQSTPAPTDAAEGLNTAGLGTILWIVMLAVVFFVLLGAAALGLLSARKKRINE
jgi:hypothetical protein